MIKFDFKNIKFYIIVLIMLTVSFILLTLCFKNNDLYKLSTVSQAIYNLNKDLDTTVHDNTFNFPDSKNIFQEKIFKLQKLNSYLDDIKIDNKNINLKHQLSSYIQSNITLYESGLAILNMQNPNKFSYLYNNLIKSEQNILKNTNNLKNSKLNISFPKEANIFFLNLNQYVNDSFKKIREKDIIYSQKQDFLIQMNLILSDFSYLKENLEPVINNIKNTHRSLSILLEDLNMKNSKYFEIKNKSYSIILPYGTENTHSSLIEMLNSYEIYINSMEHSIQYDIENSNDYKSKNSINNKYKDSFDKYNTFLSCYNDLINNIKIYKKQ